jgi:hypothetical protein
MEFFDQGTVRVFKKLSTVFIISGFPKQEVLDLTRNPFGWLILINLDALAMLQYNISDVRFLLSPHLKWEQKSVVTQKVHTPYLTMLLSWTYQFQSYDINMWLS